MRFLLALFIALGVSALGPTMPASAGATPESALPAGSRLAQYIPVPALPGVYALTYAQAGWHLGLVQRNGSGYSLRWTRALTGTPKKLTIIPQGDAFRVVTTTRSRRQLVYAYGVRGSTVLSVIANVKSGFLEGTGGVVLHADGFSVREREVDHVGTVAYRTVTRYVWKGGLFRRSHVMHEPDYGRPSYPSPSGWVITASGDTYLLRLEIAATEGERETGLMNRTNLDPDSGMVFSWGTEIHASFWMENTLIPLSIAFLGRDGTVHEIQDMQAASLDYHSPAHSYWYAIEANLGYFQTHGIKPGDQFHLELQP